MLRSVIIANARKHVNDTDTSTPFHTDNQCHAILDNWEREIRRRIKFPKKTESESFTVGQGGGADSRGLDSDWLAITRAILIPLPATGYEHKILRVISEDEMDSLDPAWRDRTEQAEPGIVVISGVVGADASEYSNLSVYLDRVVDGSYTLRLNGIQLNAASTDATLSPPVPGAYHTSAEFYLAAYMLMPRNRQKGEAFLGDFEREFRRAKSEGQFIQTETADVWGAVPDFGN